MLRFHTDSGALEVTADEESRVRGMTDADLCHQLNTANVPDLFVFAEVQERNTARYEEGIGWVLENLVERGVMRM